VVGAAGKHLEQIGHPGMLIFRPRNADRSCAKRQTASRVGRERA